MLLKNEVLDDLNLKGYQIIQSNDGFKFGIDAVLLANFVKPKSKDVGVDLGSGTGIISTIIAAKSNVSKIIGIEIQKPVYEMSLRSTELNKLNEKLSFIHGDIKDISSYFPKDSFDFVTSNPPYYKTNTLSSKNTLKNSSRHEFLVELSHILYAASYLLKSNKSFYIIHKPERLVELFELGRKYKLEPKEICFIHPNYHKAPNLVLLKYVKNGNPGLKYREPLYVYDQEGNYSSQINEIYSNQSIGE